MRNGLHHPDPALQAAALRYAAGDLSPDEAIAFETRLADDQAARDALSEAVRLSAATLGQEPPIPHQSFRAAVRERLIGWCPAWLARRAYRGHPAVWAGVGAALVAACTLVGLTLADPSETDAANAAHVAVEHVPAASTEGKPTVAPPVPVASVPHETEPLAAVAHAAGDCADETGPSVAEIWAQLSTPDNVEKAHDEELKWRSKLFHTAGLHSGRPTHIMTDSREP